MQFDNSRFERNVQTTLGTLSKLNEKLKFKDADKSFKNIDKAASEVSLSGMANSIDNISSKFSTMGIVGMTVIQNLTNSIIDKVKSTVGTVVGLISEGGKNRALNIEQAKFQLEGLGVAWKDISGDINYGVKDTAYGLDSAAKVASQLVASSVQLGEPMRTALRSISGVAAMTSSTYDDIGRIYTTVAGNGRLMTEQLNQFSGRGLNAAATLRDYFNSSEENMLKFYELYTKTAKKSDEKVTKGAEATEANIRKMVTNGAISFEIFSEAMDKAYGEHAKSANKTYEGSLSNVKAALSRIGADFHTPKLENLRNIFNALIPVIDGVHTSLKPVSDEFTETTAVATKFITDILGKFDGSKLEVFLTSISSTVGKWREDGGVVNLLQSLVNVGSGIKSVFKPIKEAFTDIFPPVTATNLTNITNGLLLFTEKLKLSDSASNNLKNAFKGLFSFSKTLFNVIKTGVIIFGNFLNSIKSLLSPLLSLIGNFGDTSSKISSAADEMNVFDKSVETSSKILKPLASGLETFSEKVVSCFDSIHKKVGGVSGLFKKIGTVVGKIFSGIVTALDNMFSSSGFSKISEIINGGIFVYALDLFRRILIYIRKFTSEIDPFSDMMAQFRDTLFEYQRDLKANVLMKLAVAVALLAGSILLISNIDSEKLGSATAAIISLYAGMFAVMKIMSKMRTDLSFADTLKNLIQVKAVDDIATSLIKMAVAVLILSKAMTNLSHLEWEEIGKGLVAITGLVTILSVSAIAMSKLSGKMTKASKGLILMSIAVSILASAMKKMGNLSLEQIAKGLGALAGSLTILTIIVARLTTKDRNLIKVGAGLILIATAVKILGKALNTMSQMNLIQMGIALGALAGSFTVITIAVARLTTKERDLVKTGAGLVLLSAAIKILANALVTIGSLKWDQMGVALISLSVSLAAITTSVAFLTKKESNLVKTGAGLVLIASGIKILSDALVSMGSMNWAQMGVSLISLVVALAAITASVFLLTKKEKSLIQTGLGLLLIASSIEILSKALTTMGGMTWEQMGVGLISLATSLTVITIAVNFMKTALSGAAAILVVSASLVVLAGALKMMGSMSWEQMGIALITLAASLTIIGVAGYALGPVVPVIAGLAGAIALLGVGCLTAGVGVLAFSAGLLALSAAGGAVGSILIGLITTVLNYIPLLGAKLAEGLVMFCVIIAQSAPQIADSVLVVLTEILKVLTNAIPMITGFIFGVLSALMWQIVAFVPDMTEAGLQLLIGLIDGIANNVGRLIDSATNLMVEFINGMANSIRDNQEAIFNAVRNLMGSIIEIMITCLQTIALLIPGIGDDISSKLEDAKLNVREAFSSDEMATIGSEAASGFSNGLSENESVSVAGSNLGNDFKTSLSESLSGLNLTGNEAASGFLSGVSEDSEIANLTGINFGENFKSGLSNGVSGTNEIGQVSGTDFINGISSKETNANTSGKNLAEKAKEGASTVKTGFETAGEDSGTGFCNGLRSKLKSVWDAGKELGLHALDAAKRAVDSNSPSKKFDKLGRDCDRGLVNGFIRLSGLVEKAASNVSEKSLSVMTDTFADISNMVDDDIEYSPRISPIINMSEVETGSRKINGMFRNKPVMNLSASIEKISDVSSRMKNSDRLVQNDLEHHSSGNTYNYTQNNYSPKALSRLDIYRQTKNLFALQMAESEG